MSALIITRPNGQTSRIDVARPSWAACLQLEFNDYYQNPWTAFYDEWKPDGDGVPREIKGFKFAGQYIEVNEMSEEFMEAAQEALAEDYEQCQVDAQVDDAFDRYREMQL